MTEAELQKLRDKQAQEYYNRDNNKLTLEQLQNIRNTQAQGYYNRNPTSITTLGSIGDAPVNTMPPLPNSWSPSVEGILPTGIAGLSNQPIATAAISGTGTVSNDAKKNQLWIDYQTNLQNAQREATLARRQADEAAFLRQRQMNQALVGRGLANSGIEAVGAAQNQMALGQQLDQQAAQQAGVNAGLYQQYQQGLAAEDKRQSDLYTTIMNTAIASGKTGEELSTFAQQIASGYGVTLNTSQLGSIEATGNAVTPPGPVSGKFDYMEPLASASKDGVGWFKIDTGSGKEKIDTTGYEDAANKYKEALKERYAGETAVLKLLDKIQITATQSFGGYDFKFTYGGKTYADLKKLVDALNAASS